jgi:hypothetical protein
MFYLKKREFMKQRLTITRLKKAAKEFCEQESCFLNSELYGVTDGKAIGTYVEQKFQSYLSEKYDYEIGSSAKGIDLPDKKINTDIKVTSVKQPQSSCPFTSANQKVFGLEYNLLLFVYEKEDIHEKKAAKIDFLICAFIDKERTADYTTTFRLREMLKDGAIKEDIITYLCDRNIPADDFILNQMADKIIEKMPEQGYLSISNALQWRLQYQRVVSLSEPVAGISKIVDKIKK